MTYLELYDKARRKLDRGEILLGEYLDMIAPLTEEISDLQVVRCKDCINYEKDSLGLMGCRITQYVANDDDFCSWGERKGGDSE